MAENQKQLLQFYDIPDNERAGKNFRGGTSAQEQGIKEPTTVFKPLPPGIGVLKRGILFTVFDKEQRKEAALVVNFLRNSKDFKDFVNNASILRPIINETLFIYALSVSVMQSPFAKNLQLPPLWQVFPHHFFNQSLGKEFNDEIQTRSSPTTNEPKPPIEITMRHTGNIRDPEHKVAYFREDIGLNSHHWHWHLIYPTFGTKSQTPIKDRKGELFYYMHQQMLAHYDAERLSNEMSRVQTLHDYDETIPEGYMPNLYSKLAGQEYGARPANLRMRDLPSITINTMETWRERINHAISLKYIILPDGSSQSINDAKGIDILGDLVESSDYSLNPDFYGELHNNGHVIISRIHDPDGRYNGAAGVMSYVETAIRDSIFFRWHKHIDRFFQDHKATLPAYTEQELKIDNIEIQEAEVVSEITNDKKNTFYTFFENRQINLSKGMDFMKTDEKVLVTITHIQHEEFQYNIKVNNKTGKDFEATIRIFMAPKFNDLGDLINLNEQRTLMMEMDKFQMKLSKGENNITRKSQDSNVTLHSEKTWEIIEEGTTGRAATVSTNFCGCGWPHHMLLPKGKPLGMVFQIFIMITNWEEDKVKSTGAVQQCHDAVSYCGLADDLYPDKKPMGFPFDRTISDKIEEFTSRPNMKFFDISIIHRMKPEGSESSTRPVRQ